MVVVMAMETATERKMVGSNGLTTDTFPVFPANFGMNIPETTGGIPVSGLSVAGDNVLNEFQPSYREAYPSTEVLDPADEGQYARIEKAIYDLLDAFNVNWDDPNYTETPHRVAKAYTEYWANGYARQPEQEVTVFPNSSGSGDLVMVKDMQFYSLCSHHLAPFKGQGAIAYLPGDNLLGLSKLGRILDIYARRFQLQERIGAQAADAIMRLIEPQGVMVVLYDVEHMCMSSRGVQMHAANTTTVATRGVFKTQSDLRNQVLSLLR
jgi:GTP cyclohydrolase I